MTRRYTFAVVNPNVSLWPLCVLGDVLRRRLKPLAGRNYPDMLGEWRHRTNRFALDLDAYADVGKPTLLRVLENPSWGWRKLRNIPIACRRLLACSHLIERQRFAQLSNRDLLRLYVRYNRVFQSFYVPAWFPNLVEGPNASFSAYLNSQFGRRLGTSLAGEALSVLLAPLRPSFREREHRDLFALAGQIRRTQRLRSFFSQSRKAIERELPRFDPEVDRAITKHWRTYRWIPFDYDGPAWPRSHFIREVRHILRSAPSQKTNGRLRQRQKELMRRLHPEVKFRRVIQLGRALAYWKDYRKDVLFQSYCAIDGLFREIGRRLRLTPIEVKYVLPNEMAGALLKHRINHRLLQWRMRYTVMLFSQRGMRTAIGRQARAWVQRYVRPDNDARQKSDSVQGQCAYPGMIRGRVRQVYSPADMKKLKSGDVLVSPATNPNLLQAMRRAAAIVTDKGGITAHAAIVARELQKPCVIGTKNATQVFKDGDRVEVDAEKGVVRKV